MRRGCHDPAIVSSRIRHRGIRWRRGRETVGYDPSLEMRELVMGVEDNTPRKGRHNHEAKDHNARLR